MTPSYYWMGAGEANTPNYYLMTILWWLLIIKWEQAKPTLLTIIWWLLCWLLIIEWEQAKPTLINIICWLFFSDSLLLSDGSRRSQHSIIMLWCSLKIPHLLVPELSLYRTWEQAKPTLQHSYLHRTCSWGLAASESRHSHHSQTFPINIKIWTDFVIMGHSRRSQHCIKFDNVIILWRMEFFYISWRRLTSISPSSRSDV